MRNFWIQRESAFATWIADLSPLHSKPDVLLEFASFVISTGRQQRIFEVIEAPVINYQSEQDGSLSQFLKELYHKQQVVDFFDFTGAAMAPGRPGSSTVRTTLAWYDVGDRLIEGECTDLAILLTRLQPVPDCIPTGFRRHYPPLRVRGTRLKYNSDTSSEQRRVGEAPSVKVQLAIHSDIWFPWIFGPAHIECDYVRMFDNRDLANRHTPRLNAFLGAVSAKARSLGGSWQLDPDEKAVIYERWISEDGIRLDIAPPAENRMPPSIIFDAEWL